MKKITPKKTESEVPAIKPKPNMVVRGITIALGVILLAGIGFGLFALASTPKSIRKPASAHDHFRIQIVVNGKAENFGEQKYQTPYDPSLCTAAITEAPFHFHDNKDQFAHIHWNNMTGGQWLKNYGWNFIGGMPNSLGYRQEEGFRFAKVPIFGHILPEQPKDANYYIYIGDQEGFTAVNWSDFLHKDLETFFANKAHALVPVALAHGTAEEHAQEGPETEQQRLERINSLIGNVVIFVQKDKPTNEDVKARFNQLAPLSESTCGG